MVLVFLAAVSQIYRAILDKDHVRWTGDSPEREGPVDVYITVIGADEQCASKATGQAMANALQEIAIAGG